MQKGKFRMKLRVSLLLALPLLLSQIGSVAMAAEGPDMVLLAKGLSVATAGPSTTQ